MTTPSAISSPTPRTDAVCSTNDIPRLGYGHPLADLARQLERELAEAEAELERRQAKIMRLTSPSSSSVACVSDEQLQDTYATVCAEQGHMAGLRAIVQRSTGRTPETPRWTDAAEAAFEKWWQSWREANGYANTQRMRETARAVYVEIAYSPITAAMEKLAAEGNLEIANRSTVERSVPPEIKSVLRGKLITQPKGTFYECAACRATWWNDNLPFGREQHRSDCWLMGLIERSTLSAITPRKNCPVHGTELDSAGCRTCDPEWP